MKTIHPNQVRNSLYKNKRSKGLYLSIPIFIILVITTIILLEIYPTPNEQDGKLLAVKRQRR
jgi:hypothetical protein